MPLRLSGSTGVSGIDGTAQAPAVQGTNPNAGIYYSGNNVIVSTSGNTALTVGPSGNVAISNSFSISGQFVSAYSGMMKNRIINGDMRIDQRFNGAANNNINGFQYTVDRWYTYGTVAAKLRFQQNNTNGPGQTATQAATGFSRYFGANTVAANTVNAGDNWILAQAIEGFNIDDLDWGTSIAASATLSFWVYSSIAGTHGGSIQNGNSDRSYPFQYTINTANTWQYQTITVPGDTTGSWFSNTSAGMYLVFSLGTGSNSQGTTNAWQSGAKFPTGIVQPVSAANGSFYLTGVQLEKGSQATAFDFRHYTTELQLCQRYYEVLIVNNNASSLLSGYLTSSAYWTSWYFKQQKRATPTVALLSGASWAGGTPAIYPTLTQADFGLSASQYFYLTGTANSPGLYASAEL